MADSTNEDSGGDKSKSALFNILAITEHDRDLAAQALAEFDKGQYEAAMGFLNKLAGTRGPDPKVAHNKAVTEYYMSHLKKTDEFKQAMGAVCAKAQVNIDQINALDDVDQCVIFFNQAVILYYLRQYHTAIAIMEKLYQFIEPMDTLGKRVLFLLVELYLSTQQPEKAMVIVGFIEKHLFGNGKSLQAALDRNDKEENKEEGKEPSSQDELRSTVSHFKARAYMMLKSMKQCKREVKSLMNCSGMTTPILYIKSNFEYLRGNYRKAIKVLNTNQQNKSLQDTGEHVPTMYYNNLGCIHFHMKKHHLGAFYLRKAIHENEQAVKQVYHGEKGKSLSGKALHTLGVSRHYELLYNMGIQLLHCGKALAAFDCLIDTVQMYQVNPRLWLRLAECCIMVHKASNEENHELQKRLQVVQGSLGSGMHRKLILGTGVRTDIKCGESAAMPVATMEFASLCLRNSLALLMEDPLTATPPPVSDDQPETSKSFENVSVPAPPGSPMRSTEVANLRCSILCQSAYVALCLNDFVLAIHHSERLLKQPRLSGAHKYLGHMYMAEALVAMDRIADAVTHLDGEEITDISLVPPEEKKEQDKNGEKDQEGGETKGALFNWSPRDLTMAKAYMQYNLSTAYTMRGEYEKAMLNLTKSTTIMGNPLPAQAYFLKLYLELIQGHSSVALGIVKEHFGHVTPNQA